MKVAHLTSVHYRFDIRIFHKMCSSLSLYGHDVTLVVADGLGNEIQNGIKVVDVGSSKGRRDRILNAPDRILAMALNLDADIYHLHDPELWRIGASLKRSGHRVIFDSHEDIPKQILSKPYLNKAMLWAISNVLRVYEAWVCRKFDGVIAATPFICDKFLHINLDTVTINNFPRLNELLSQVSWESKRREVCYVGGIGKIRGILEMVQSMGEVKTGTRLNLCGRFDEPSIEATARAQLGWDAVNELGFLDRPAVREVLARSIAGLVVFHPSPNHIDAQPNKIFEYMSAGIPVIASDFPLWRQIVEGNSCGLCVDPLKPTEIASAIDYLVTNPNEAQRMGQNGRRAVEDSYSWSKEEKKLLAFYHQIYGRSPK